MKSEWKTCKDETVIVRILKKDWDYIKQENKNETLMTTLHKMLNGLKNK